MSQQTINEIVVMSGEGPGDMFSVADGRAFNALYAQVIADKAETATYVTDYATPQDAVNSLPPSGGVIYFPRTLTGEFTISTPITTNVPNTKFRCYRGTRIITTDVNGDAFLLQHDNCDVQGFRITGTGSTATLANRACGVKLIGTESCTVKKNKISGMGGHGIYLGFLGTVGCSNNVIKQNKIYDLVGTIEDTAGVMLGYSGDNYSHDHNIIKHNYINGSNITKHGVAMICHGKGNVVSFNRIFNTVDYGIIAYESQYVDFTFGETTISNNHIENIGVIAGTTNKGMGIYLQKSHDSFVVNNTVKNSLLGTDLSETLARGSIALNSSLRCIVSGNEINGSKQHGIIMVNSFESNAINNIISNIDRVGIYVKGSNDNRISGNTLKAIGKNGVFGSFYVTDAQGVIGYYNLPTGVNIDISDNIIENLENEGIGITGTTTSLIRNATILNNKIKSSTGFITATLVKDSIIAENICDSESIFATIQVTNALSDNVKILDNVIKSTLTINVGILYQGTNPVFRGNQISTASTYISYQDQNLRNEPFTAFAVAMPTSGAWIADTYISKVNRIQVGTSPNKYIIKGWIRTTTGSENTLNTDWFEDRALTGN